MSASWVRGGLVLGTSACVDCLFRRFFLNSLVFALLTVGSTGCILGWPSANAPPDPTPLEVLRTGHAFPIFDASGTRSEGDDARVATLRIGWLPGGKLQLGDECIVPIEEVGGAFVLAGQHAACRVENESMTILSVSGQALRSRGHYLSFVVSFVAKGARGLVVHYDLRAGDCEGGRLDCR